MTPGFFGFMDFTGLPVAQGQAVRGRGGFKGAGRRHMHALLIRYQMAEQARRRSQRLPPAPIVRSILMHQATQAQHAAEVRRKNLESESILGILMAEV